MAGGKWEEGEKKPSDLVIPDCQGRVEEGGEEDCSQKRGKGKREKKVLSPPPIVPAVGRAFFLPSDTAHAVKGTLAAV